MPGAKNVPITVRARLNNESECVVNKVAGQMDLMRADKQH